MYQRTYKNQKRRFSAISAVLLAAVLLAGCTQAPDATPSQSNAPQISTNPSSTSTRPTDTDATGTNPTDSTPAPTPPADTEAPQILQTRELLVYVGDSLSYFGAVTVTDDCDPIPTVTVDNSRVDLTKAGTYEVIYIATDATGNTARMTATVTVLYKEAGAPDLETINETADALLATIITDGATVKEQVQAIYRWARYTLSYGGHSDRTDWRQSAYTMITERKGDCYGYFAATKLLFERLGIPNIDVQKVRNFPDDSDHFWSLVSVDGGETYYHFDATPRVGEGDDFCLVTDAFLDDYSAANKGSHNRDKSLYPATPEAAP